MGSISGPKRDPRGIPNIYLEHEINEELILVPVYKPWLGEEENGHKLRCSKRSSNQKCYPSHIGFDAQRGPQTRNVTHTILVLITDFCELDIFRQGFSKLQISAK